MKAFTAPDFVIAEVTQNESFLGRNLVGETFAEMRRETENGKWKTEN